MRVITSPQIQMMKSATTSRKPSTWSPSGEASPQTLQESFSEIHRKPPPPTPLPQHSFRSSKSGEVSGHGFGDSNSLQPQNLATKVQATQTNKHVEMYVNFLDESIWNDQINSFSLHAD